MDFAERRHLARHVWVYVSGNSAWKILANGGGGEGLRKSGYGDQDLLPTITNKQNTQLFF